MDQDDQMEQITVLWLDAFHDRNHADTEHEMVQIAATADLAFEARCMSFCCGSPLHRLDIGLIDLHRLYMQVVVMASRHKHHFLRKRAISGQSNESLRVQHDHTL